MKRGWMFFLAAAVCAATIGSGRARAQEWDEGLLAPPPPPDEAPQPEDVPSADGSAPDAQDVAPPAQAPDEQTFEQRLSPYGRWVDTPEYGRVWIPSGVSSDWQPYTDGQWVDTEYGWTFASTVPWGWAAFHYGRWGWGMGLGWFWVPGFTWAPAWVGWRSYGGYRCWSPLAPRGWAYRGRWPGWVAMDRQHFTRPIRSYAVPRAQVGAIVTAARPIGGFGSRYGGHAYTSARPYAGARTYGGGFGARTYSGGSRTYAGAPHAYSSAPRVYSGAPRTYSGAPHAYSGAPRVYSGAPRTYSGAPHVYGGGGYRGPSASAGGHWGGGGFGGGARSSGGGFGGGGHSGGGVSHGGGGPHAGGRR